MSLPTNPSPSTPSRKPSITSQTSSHSKHALSKAWKALKKHHADMTEAYNAFYAPPGLRNAGSGYSSRVTSAQHTPRGSFEEQGSARRSESQKARSYQRLFKVGKAGSGERS